MDVLSHIQMPKCVLKRFSDEQNRLSYYDVQKGVLSKNGHAKSINTQLGYYSESTETFLNKYIEAPFSRFLHKVHSIDFNSENPDMSVLNDDIIFLYIYSLISRSPSILSISDNYSNIWSSLNVQHQHDFAAIRGIILAKKNCFLSNFAVSLMINQTKKPLILPTIGIYSFKKKDVIHIVAPISPQLAIILIEKKLNNSKTIPLYTISDEVFLDYLNAKAFKAQQNEKNGFVVSPDLSILEDIKTSK